MGSQMLIFANPCFSLCAYSPSVCHWGHSRQHQISAFFNIRQHQMFILQFHIS